MLFPLDHVGAAGVLKLPFYPGPHILDWIEVWAVALQIDKADVQPLIEPFGHHL